MPYLYLWDAWVDPLWSWDRVAWPPGSAALPLRLQQDQGVQRARRALHQTKHNSGIRYGTERFWTRFFGSSWLDQILIRIRQIRGGSCQNTWTGPGKANYFLSKFFIACSLFTFNDEIRYIYKTFVGRTKLDKSGAVQLPRRDWLTPLN